jgi:SAM-dependent methyltransferase
MVSKDHWERIYASHASDAVSWYAEHLGESLRYIRATGLGSAAAVIDVGGGESTLVDDLLADGYQDVTVLDISETALDVCRSRLGEDAAKVSWVAADILTTSMPRARFDIWHDRAVFHFLTEMADRVRYVGQVLHALKPNGYAIVGTFGPAGPEKCSGLPVSRYAPDELHAAFGAPFELLASSSESHVTPAGTTQQFVYCFCRRHGQLQNNAQRA